MKLNSPLLTTSHISGLLLSLVALYGCSKDLTVDETTETSKTRSATTSSVTFDVNQGNEMFKPTVYKESTITQYTTYLFYQDKLVETNTSKYNPSGTKEVTLNIPQPYQGKLLKAMIIANDRVVVQDRITPAELSRQATTKSSPNTFSSRGFPMATTVDFYARPHAGSDIIDLETACSGIYANISDGRGDLSDFSFTISGVQQKNGFLFQEGAVAGATENLQVDYDMLTGQELKPLAYYYPTNGDIRITVRPKPSKYSGVNPITVVIPRDKALLKNQKFILSITPTSFFSHFKVTIKPWSEAEENQTTLKDLNVFTGSIYAWSFLELTEGREDEDCFILNANGDVVPALLKFSLPEGASIHPNPNELLKGGYQTQTFRITAASGKVGKPFRVKYYPDKLYTLVVLGDTEYGFRGYSYDQARKDMNKLPRVKHGHYYFKEHPSVRINPELLMVVGDVSGDRDNAWSQFETIFGNCYNAGIKCMNIYGNHDWDPEFWGFSDGTPDYNDPGFTLDGIKQNQESKLRIKKAAAKSGIGITDFAANKGETPFPYYFTYRGVRYYCGNSFWFMPSFSTTPFPLWGSGALYNSDKIIRDLEGVLNRDGNKYPAIWMHHYPLRSDNKWWGGYGYGGDYVWPSAGEGRKRKMPQLIGKTKNPAAFAGHIHYSAVDTYTDPASGKKFTEYVTPYFRENGGSGYFVLVSEKEGVLSVEEFNFKQYNFN